MVRKFDEFFTGGKTFGNEGSMELSTQIEEGFSKLTESQTQSFELMGGMFQAMRHMYEIVMDSAEREKRFEAQIKQLISDIATVKDATTDALSLAKDAKLTHYVGKTSEFIESALEKAKDVPYDEVRKAVYRATGNQQDAYNVLYGKLYEQVGISVRDEGKKAVKKTDKLTDSTGVYVKASKTYYNSVFLAGYKAELYLIAQEMIQNK